MDDPQVEQVEHAEPYTLEGTALAAPFPTPLEGIGMLNFPNSVLRQIELCELEIQKRNDLVAQEVESHTLDDLTGEERNEMLARLDALRVAVREAKAKQDFIIVTRTLCKHPSGEPIGDFKDVDDFYRKVGDFARKRFHRAYMETLREVGKLD